AMELEQEHRRLANAKDLIQSCDRILQQLSDAEQQTVNDILSRGHIELSGMAETDPQLAGVAEMINTALIQVQEASSELRHYLDSMELDPERLEDIAQRLSDIHELSRKHHVSAEDLAALLPQFQTELEQLEKADESLEQLKRDIDEASKAYRETAATLSKSRKKFARQLSKQVTDSLQTLGMDGGIFQIDLHTDEAQGFSAQGMERIEFMVSANPGQPLKPLARVASGGELSRISLSIQVKAAEQVRIPTLVFDEVDVGIGGRVAEIVGYLLRDLARHRQVLCVTHLPQVAALGHHHLQVRKQVDNHVTVTSITPLNEVQRIDEVARMLGGMEITAQTLSHAREMLERAQA
ncbi:MAG: DNA repair protein RecN, partial [Gammaproteobacteria bacterium]